MKRILVAVLMMSFLAACAPSQNEPVSAEETREFTVYFVADTPRGFKLYSEIREITAMPDSFATEIITQLISGQLQPIDPDYVNLWDDSNSLNQIDLLGTNATVNFNLGKLNVGAESEIRAIEQIVWTLTEISPTITTVRFLVNGEKVESFAGHVDTTVDFKRAPDYEVLSPLQIDSLLEGAELANPLILSGFACTFEANVVWTVTQNNELVLDGVTTAAAACPERSKWEVELADLPAGEYLFKVEEFSAEDGSLFAVDSKRFTIR